MIPDLKPKPNTKPDRVYTAVALFGGGGLLSMGLEEAQPGWRGVTGKIHVRASVDAWEQAAKVHQYLCPGSRSVVLDLFSRQDYEDYHGHAPPESWREVAPADLRALCPEGPDLLVTSPPCQGFSSNLSDKLSKTPKYQALCRLTLRGLWLALEAWRDRLPRLMLLENVPRIVTRGAELLRLIRALLASYGYTYDERIHDAGELGGLAQSRKRFLLAARLKTGAPFPVHLPVRQGLKSIGEVLSQLPCPLPGAVLPPMHAVPQGQHWLTALRLALIRPGRDWRDLRQVLAYEVRWRPGATPWLVGALYEGAEGWQVPCGWDDAVSLGRWAVNPETLGRAWSRETAYTVRGWDQTMGTVAASRGGATASGAPYVTDPRVYGNKHADTFRPRRWDEPSGVVTGALGAGAGGVAVADPRLGCAPRAGAYGVLGWGETSPTVAASVDVHAGCAAVADPRGGACEVFVGEDRLGEGVAARGLDAHGLRQRPDADRRRFAGPGLAGGGDRRDAPLLRGVEEGLRGACVVGSRAVGGSGGDPCVAQRPALPSPTDRGAWVILSPGGAWHRPCTTLEVALLQGLPATVRGEPLDFYALGLSDADARQVIGNGVPPPAAQAIGEEFGQALLESDGVVPVRLFSSRGRWVMPAAARMEAARD